MQPVKALAGGARRRQPVRPDNPFLAMEQLVAEQIEQSLNLFRDVRDAMLELAFHAIYGSPLMRMIGAQGLAAREEASDENLLMLPDVRAALDHIEQGGEAEGTVRMLELLSEARGYVRRSRLERELQVFATEEPFRSMDEEARARLIHEQSLVVQFAPTKAKAACRDCSTRQKSATARSTWSCGSQGRRRPCIRGAWRSIASSRRCSDAGLSQPIGPTNGFRPRA